MEKVKPWLGEPQNTIAVLQKYGFVFQKKYGQNFLIDPHVLDKIVAAAGIGPDDFVVEIGPGIGTLTQYLAYAARSVCAVEIDKNLIPILEDAFRQKVPCIIDCPVDYRENTKLTEHLKELINSYQAQQPEA